jgi:selenide,water dikinase
MKMSSDEDTDLAKKVMKTLNSSGAEVMKKYKVKGATDVTGYGLAGHALKMARASNVTIEIDLGKVPLIGDTLNLVEEGCIPGASFRNLEFVENDSHLTKDLTYNLKMIAMDAQTSGGLLMCVPPEESENVLSELHNVGLVQSAVIGKVTEKKEKYLYLNN